MKQFITRDFSRTEHDDYIINAQPLEGKMSESLPIYKDGQLIGWLIQPRYS